MNGHAANFPSLAAVFWVETGPKVIGGCNNGTVRRYPVACKTRRASPSDTFHRKMRHIVIFSGSLTFFMIVKQAMNIAEGERTTHKGSSTWCGTHCCVLLKKLLPRKNESGTTSDLTPRDNE